MAVKYELNGVPEDIPYGDYTVRVSEASRWEGNDLIIELDYIGPAKPEDPSAFKVVKE